MHLRGYSTSSSVYMLEIYNSSTQVFAVWGDGHVNISGSCTASSFIGNVTGNCSGSAGSVAWANVTSKPSSTGSATQPVYWNGSTFVACTTYANASVNYATSAGSATYASYLKGPDNRSSNNAPSWYMSNKGSASLYGEFCQTGGANGNYEYRMTMTPWGDNSGQRPVQMAFNNSGAF